MLSKAKSGVNEKAQEFRENQIPQYVPPLIITYTSEEVLEKIGPAQTCSPGPCPVTP
jgi:hypothetical protein